MNSWVYEKQALKQIKAVVMFYVTLLYVKRDWQIGSKDQTDVMNYLDKVDWARPYHLGPSM